MQVNYRTTVQGSSYAALFNEAAGDSLERVSGQFVGILQREPLAGSPPSQARFPRGNAVGKNTFKWTSTYATADAAETAIGTINALKLIAVHLQRIEGATKQYLPNAIAEQYEYERQGSSVTHTLTFESDDLTTIAP